MGEGRRDGREWAGGSVGRFIQGQKYHFDLLTSHFPLIFFSTVISLKSSLRNILIASHVAHE